MGTAEKFCLRWNDFEANISSAFRELREDKDFFDVTLACDDNQIQAHKVILSACSPFFRTVLKRNRHEHPLLYLKGVKYIDLVAVLNFMYHGEVNVAQEELNSFLAIAEELKVKGLTQNGEDGSQRPSPKPRAPPAERLPAPPLAPPAKRPRPAPSQPPAFQKAQMEAEVEEVEEVTFPEEVAMVKSEPGSLGVQGAEHQIAEADYTENYDGFEGYEEGEEGGFEGALLPAGGTDGNKGNAQPSRISRPVPCVCVYWCEYCSPACKASPPDLSHMTPQHDIHLG